MTEKTNILIVDDLPEKLLLYQSVLEELGQNLITARSGPEALKQVLRHDFAVILLDVNMPGMDGFETATLIRKRKKSAHTPIIFITAFADDIHIAQGYAHGAVDFIPTPVLAEVLRSKVRVFVELFGMTQQVKQQAKERMALAEERLKRAAAEDTNRRLTFLARAGTVLGRSLDAATTCRDVVRLPIPFLADEAILAVADGGLFHHVVTARVAQEGGDVAVDEHVPLERLPATLVAKLQNVLQTATPEFYDPEDPSTTIAAPTISVWPLQARGRSVGAMALLYTFSGRRYAPTELTMAEALASRGAVAVDNARLHRDLQEADRRKDEFLAMLAHELRNPLGPIRNAVHVLGVEGAPDSAVVQARQMIDRQVTHMARLVDDLLDATRIARGKILLRRERCDLRRIVAQTGDDYRSVLEASGISFNVEVPSEPLWVEGDPTRLAQLLSNLLHNAHKFTNPGGQVTLRLTDERGAARITVQDTGVGIDAAMLPQLFEVFAQGDRSLDRSRGGLGLGLALVKGLAQLHGGDVRAFSMGPGRGSTFSVALPVTEPSSDRAADEDETGIDQPCRILVIEDNRDAAESARMLLSLAGHEVATAYTGNAGLELARTFQPQVVLCDIGLPGGVNGYDVAREMRADPELRGAYIIALTGYGRDEDQRQAEAAGFDLHLTKPVDFDILRRAIAMSRCKSVT